MRIDWLEADGGWRMADRKSARNALALLLSVCIQFAKRLLTAPLRFLLAIRYPLSAMRFASIRYPLSAIAFLLVSLNAVSAADPDYRLGAGDLLRISVFGAPDLSAEVRVSESGNITYPLIGQVAVSGRSPAQVEALIGAHLVEGGFVRDPQVSLLVLEYRSQQVAVLGHVVKPGQYSLQSASSVLSLLAEAGGPINEEAADFATVMRKDGSKVTVDLAKLFNGDPKQNTPIRGGDTIYVPRAPQFYVYGEVQKPGMYRLERNMTVSRAISAGGGLTSRGSERRVVIKRRDAQGKEETYSVQGSDLLQADDVLLVKEGFF
jgi:polysaccharide biosynthesis/export protein